MITDEKTAAPGPSVGADGGQPPVDRTTNLSIPSRSISFNGKSVNTLETVSYPDLREREYPPLRFTVDTILPHGLFLLAGAPKIGKSWLALALCRAVAGGESLWEFPAEKGTVLYLALEDTLPRLQSRMQHYDGDCLDTLYFAVRSLKIKDGLIAQLEAFAAAHPDLVLVVIDTMQHIRDNANDKNAYVSDYADMNILHELSARLNITLLLVTHLRKLEDPDPVNMISGSNGLSGGTDGMLILTREKRAERRGTLLIPNRDTQDFIFQLEFDPDTCHWIKLTPEQVQQPSLLFQAVLRLMDSYDCWKGSASQLLDTLQLYGFSVSSPAVLSRELNSERAALRRAGIQIDTERTANQRTVTLQRITDDDV